MCGRLNQAGSFIKPELSLERDRNINNHRLRVKWVLIVEGAEI